jgi:hypothetical protein
MVKQFQSLVHLLLMAVAAVVVTTQAHQQVVLAAEAQVQIAWLLQMVSMVQLTRAAAVAAQVLFQLYGLQVPEDQAL